MYLKDIRIQNFRCLVNIKTDVEPSINLIVGDNGSGKSSVLEALLFLSRGKSFRTGAPEQAIREGADALSVFARFETALGESNAGATRELGKTRLQLAGDYKAGILALAKSLPIQMVDPGIHRLSEEGPTQRRQFVDWGVFHVEQGFYSSWKRYRRVLRQRNKALKSHAASSLAPLWNEELISAGRRLDQYRRAHVSKLSQLLAELGNEMIEDTALSVRYRKGWREELSLSEAIESSLERDIRSGYTSCGPHRADIGLGFGDALVKKRASRGEQKAITILLFLSQATIVAEETGESPVLLIDDLAAEMGERLRFQIGEVIASSSLQCFLTALDSQLIPPALAHGKMFHVEQGGLHQVV